MEADTVTIIAIVSVVIAGLASLLGIYTHFRMRKSKKSGVNWTTRRYQVNSFDRRQLKSEIKAWVRTRGFSIYAGPKFDAIKLYWSSCYTIAKSKWSLLSKSTIAMYVSYRAPILYVFSTSELPSELSLIHDEVFTDYAKRHGGHAIEETPLAFSTSYFSTSPLSHYFESLKVDYSLVVSLEPHPERIEAAAEEIRVPAGVNVNVKRSRTIKRVVELLESTTDGGRVEAGLKVGQLEIIKATIHSEIQRQTGRRFEETETIEHEVSLSGEKSEAYRLVWADLLRNGVVEIHESGQIRLVPFCFREQTELQVFPA